MQEEVEQGQDQSTEQTEAPTQQQDTETLTQPEQTEPQAPSMVELDGLDKFRWAGRELTPKDLQSMVLMQSDYTRKTQAISEERKYYDNLHLDLDAVAKDPKLAAQFRQVYPKKFHEYLRHVTPKEEAQALGQQQQGKSSNAVDPEFMRRFETLEKDMTERKVNAIESDINSKFEVLGKKYPYAKINEEAVIARAEALLDRDPNIEMSMELWDKIWKAVNDKNQKLAEQLMSQRVNEQKSANLKGRDVAGGGGIPGVGKKVPRTIKEAAEALIESGELDSTG